MSTILTPTGFLKVGGAVLLALGLIGATGITNGIQFFNLDMGENVAHTVLGVVGLAVGFGIKDVRIHRGLVAVLAITGFLTGLIGFVLPAGDYMHGNVFGVANLENPADNLLHLVVGVWATVAVMRAGAGQSDMATQRA